MKCVTVYMKVNTIYGQKSYVWLTACESGDDQLCGFYGSTRAIMFYSVPHWGSLCAQINLPLLRQSVELTEVQTGK
jgi:hypothetical protein